MSEVLRTSTHNIGTVGIIFVDIKLWICIIGFPTPLFRIAIDHQSCVKGVDHMTRGLPMSGPLESHYFSLLVITIMFLQLSASSCYKCL